jgi:hypothetical protein
MGNSRKGASAGGHHGARASATRGGSPESDIIIIQHLLSGDEMPDLQAILLAAC